ncbi:MAG: leucine--tRNA ligase [Longimicrobiales bacterium]
MTNGRRDADDYDAIAIENRWQTRWDDEGTNRFTESALRTAKRPFYNLMMFPYPSAEGLHVGNMYAFTGADIYGRWKRLLGEDVFEPIGFDAFGIHSENFAMKVGVHPMELIPRNIANFTRQLKRIGAMYDWDHTVDTTAPEYYKWTQWIFLQLYKAGLAEKKEAAVNWCPSCMTVLSNEQVISGECERCGSKVEQRLLSQWFFRITKYAQRLLDNLEWIDWSDSTIKAQENWIGRSEGAELRFPVVGHEPLLVPVFTTRPDTVFGATFLVLAPEHVAVASIASDAQRAEVEAYRERAASLDLVTRKKADKEKTGVFTGAYACNPATGENIPVWIADYVLMEYGTGAIMAVPGHDERDFEFAKQYDLEIRRVVAGDADVDVSPLEEAYTGPGRLVNSQKFDGMNTVDGIRSVTALLAQQGFADARVNYRLHDWCISRQRYWGPPIPILYCDRCGTVPVPETDLPVELPFVESYKPDESGVSPLARVESWYRTTCPQCGGEAKRETDVSDTFLDSAWYFLRYPSANNGDMAFDPELTKKWLPVNMYIGGEEHAVLHLLYSRFITMVLKDLGHIEFEEPYTTFRKHGLLIKEGAKMSKSRGNVVIPDAYLEKWGADTFRMYLMFLGPYQEGGDFRDQGLIGPYGFLNRLWETVLPVEELGGGAPDAGVERKLHQTIRKVTEDIAALRYNTAVAAMMEYLNTVRAGNRSVVRSEIEPLVVLVAPFAPHIAEELWERLGYTKSIFAPAEDGSDAGNWPAFDDEKARVNTIEFVISVNGKPRARMNVAPGITETHAKDVGLEDVNVQRALEGKTIRKMIFIADKLLNIVVS